MSGRPEETDYSGNFTARDNSRTHIGPHYQNTTYYGQPGWDSSERERRSKVLLQAADDGAIQRLKVQLQAGADVDFQDELGDTALHRAATKGDGVCVQALLDAGSDVHAKNKNGLTPLHSAAGTSGDPVTVRKLVSTPGIRLDAGAGDGSTALKCAVDSRKYAVIEILVRASCDVNLYSRLGKTEATSRNRYTSTTKEGSHLLHKAIEMKEPRIVSLLLSSPTINVHKRLPLGRRLVFETTTLGNAVRCGNLEVLLLLLERRELRYLADATLEETVEEGWLEGCKALVERSVSVYRSIVKSKLKRLDERSRDFSIGSDALKSKAEGLDTYLRPLLDLGGRVLSEQQPHVLEERGLVWCPPPPPTLQDLETHRLRVLGGVGPSDTYKARSKGR